MADATLPPQRSASLAEDPLELGLDRRQHAARGPAVEDLVDPLVDRLRALVVVRLEGARRPRDADDAGDLGLRYGFAFTTALSLATAGIVGTFVLVIALNFCTGALVM